MSFRERSPLLSLQLASSLSALERMLIEVSNKSAEHSLLQSSNHESVWLRRLACLTDGAYYETMTDTASVRALVADSFRLLAPASQASAAWTPTLGFKSDLNNGLVISASLAVISPATGEFLGVVGLDFRIAELQSIV